LHGVLDARHSAPERERARGERQRGGGDRGGEERERERERERESERVYDTRTSIKRYLKLKTKENYQCYHK
jgi:hypothetical protein